MIQKKYKNNGLTLTLIMLFFLTLWLVTETHASYIRYYQSDGSYRSESSTYEFFGNGNGSISVYQGLVYPTIYTQYYGNGVWVPAANGDVPFNAYVDHYINGVPLYRCRGLYQNRLFEGYLVSGDACYLQINYSTEFRTNVYDVLLR